jgi:hypothetical protein
MLTKRNMAILNMAIHGDNASDNERLSAVSRFLSSVNNAPPSRLIAEYRDEYKKGNIEISQDYESLPKIDYQAVFSDLDGAMVADKSDQDRICHLNSVWGHLGGHMISVAIDYYAERYREPIAFNINAIAEMARKAAEEAVRKYTANKPAAPKQEPIILNVILKKHKPVEKTFKIKQKPVSTNELVFTSSKVFSKAVMKLIRENGGRINVKDARVLILQPKYGIVLTEDDKKVGLLKGRPPQEPRWVNTLQSVVRGLKNDGILKKPGENENGLWILNEGK